MKKRLIAMLAALLLVGCLPMGAMAAGTVDLERTGSITVTMKIGDKPVPGGSLTLRQVGEVLGGWNYRFGLTGSFRDFPGTLEDIGSPELAQALAEYGKEFPGVTKTVDKDGTVTFDGLEVGLYLIVQEKAAGGYAKVAPFLVSVPYESDGVYIYDVDAGSKMELEKEPEPTLPPPTRPEGNLPQTGQLWWPIPLLVVGGLAFLVIGVLRHRGDKDET